MREARQCERQCQGSERGNEAHVFEWQMSGDTIKIAHPERELGWGRFRGEPEKFLKPASGKIRAVGTREANGVAPDPLAVRLADLEIGPEVDAAIQP